MEAALIRWRPLGRILVEQGLLTSEELETALEQQERTGKRLGETIVECGFVSGPELSNALASQYGIELTTETGFGTGLRGQIQRRHENERRGARPTLVDASSFADDFDLTDEPPEEVAERTPAEASLLAQLEEQWAKLAAAEARLAEQNEELTAVASQRDRRREQAVRFARAARARIPAAPTNDDELREQSARLAEDVHARDEEIARLKQENAHAHDRRASLEQSLSEGEAELAHARAELAGAHEAVAAANAAIADQERRLHELAAEFERVVQARTEVEKSLADAHGDLDERSHTIDDLHGELAQARDAVSAAQDALGDQNRRLEELGVELERVVHSRATLEQELAHLSAQNDRRRRQAERLGRRARSRATTTDEHNRRIDELEAELAHARGAVAAAETAIADQNHRLDERAAELAHARAQHDRRRRQAERLARRARARIVSEAARIDSDELLAHVGELRRQVDDLSAEARSRHRELEHLRDEHARAQERVVSLEQSLSERSVELDHVREKLGSLGAAQTALEEREHALRGLAQQLDRRRAQAVRLTRRLRSLRQVDEQQLSQIERLVADVGGCDAEIARLRNENERITRDLTARLDRARAQSRRFLERLQRQREPVAERTVPQATPSASHLVFVQLHDRYELMERPGPPPPRHTTFELPDVDASLVVAGSRRSPLPNDARPCVVAESSVVFAAD